MEESDEMRASTLIPTVHSTLESFREFLPQLYAGTESEAERAQAMVFIGSLQSMKESIEVLINSHLDDGDDEKLLLLLDIHDQVLAMLNREDLKSLQGEEEDEEEEEERQGMALSMSETASEPARETKRDTTREKIEEVLTESIEQEWMEKEEGKRENPEPFEQFFLEADHSFSAVQCDFECPICMDDIPAEEGYAFECRHPYCRECLGMYLKTTIDSGNVIDIVCPHPACRTPVLITDIHSLVDVDSYNRYQNFSLLQCLKADPSAKWCPWDGCEEIMIMDEEVHTRRAVNCTSCKRAICNMCFLKYHPNSCEENKRSMEPEDKKTAKWKKRHGIKPCPHCGVATQKVSGCPDMRCVNCRRNWSWYHDEEQWNSSGLTRKDETMIEKAAFVYPRIVKQALGSREVAANEDRKEIILTVCLFGVAGVPATVISMPPALTLRAGRSVKRKLSRVSRRIKGDSSKSSASKSEEAEL